MSSESAARAPGAELRRIAVRRVGLLLAGLCLIGCASRPMTTPPAATPVSMPQAAALAAWRAEVMATERAFARSMAERDFPAFARLVADDAVFFSGPTPLRSKPAVLAFWGRFYAGTVAPFSWDPDEVEVLDGGTFAHSSGPVRNPAGKVVARYASVWRRTPTGGWEIVFDKGSEVCDCAPASAAPAPASAPSMPAASERP